MSLWCWDNRNGWQKTQTLKTWTWLIMNVGKNTYMNVRRLLKTFLTKQDKMSTSYLLDWFDTCGLHSPNNTVKESHCVWVWKRKEWRQKSLLVWWRLRSTNETKVKACLTIFVDSEYFSWVKTTVCPTCQDPGAWDKPLRQRRGVKKQAEWPQRNNVALNIKSKQLRL